MIGRYVLVSQLGRGGMGLVYSAHDPELDRKVALKLVSPHAGLDPRDQAQVRLLREAQALARLAHPNVVSVYDVGTHGDQVWIAMEFVDGQTLRAWAGERERSWPEIVKALVEVARGVAAAHAAGLVHRDLKPENVMIGGDGRVRVMDFGLAHGHLKPLRDADSADTAVSQDPTAATAPAHPSLTMSGVILGTPAYLAPEQWQRCEVTAAADQFAWAVMAWELLHGERPFAGETMLELAAMVMTGRRRPTPRKRPVPRWLRQALVRALQVDPVQRWPTMEALITALERRRTGVLVGALALVSGLAALGYGLFAEPSGTACRVDDGALTGIWDESQRAMLQRTFTATPADQAEWRSTEKLLDRYARTWREGQIAACEAHAQGHDSDLLFERRRSCLERGRLALRSVVRVLAEPTAHQLAEPTAHQLPGAWKDVLELASLSQCANLEALRRAVAPPDETVQPQVAAVEARLQDLEIRGRTAPPEPLIPELQALEVEARQIGHAPLIAAVLRARADLESLAGGANAGCPWLLASYSLAEVAGDDALAASDARRMVFECAAPGDGKARHVELWSQVARSKLERAGLLGSRDHLLLLKHLTYDAVRRGDHAVAERTIEEALTLLKEQADPDPLVLAELHDDRATVLSGQYGKWWDPRVDESLTTALSACTQVLDADNVTCLGYEVELGTLRALSGDVAGAQALLERPLGLLTQASGVDEASRGTAVRGMLALVRVYVVLGQFQQAKRQLEHARQLYPAHSSKRDGAISVQIEVQSGHIEKKLGNAAAAAEHYEKVLADVDAWPELPISWQIDVLEALAQHLASRGQTADAAEMQIRIDALLQRVLTDDVLVFANIERTRGTERILHGKWAEAERISMRVVDALERAGKLEHPAYLGASMVLSAAHFGQEHCFAAREPLDRAARLASGASLELDVFLAGTHAVCGELSVAEAAHGRLKPLAVLLGVVGENFRNQAEIPILLRRGEPLAALPKSEKLLKFFTTSAIGNDPAMLAGIVTQHAEVLRQADRITEAEATARRAIDLVEGAYGRENIALAGALTTLGQVLLARGDHADARRHLERALVLRTANGSDPPFLAETRFALAEALASTPRTQAQAVAYAQEAAREYGTLESRYTTEIARITAWLADRLPVTPRRTDP